MVQRNFCNNFLLGPHGKSCCRQEAMLKCCSGHTQMGNSQSGTHEQAPHDKWHCKHHVSHTQTQRFSLHAFSTQRDPAAAAAPADYVDLSTAALAFVP